MTTQTNETKDVTDVKTDDSKDQQITSVVVKPTFKEWASEKVSKVPGKIKTGLKVAGAVALGAGCFVVGRITGTSAEDVIDLAEDAYDVVDAVEDDPVA